MIYILDKNVIVEKWKDTARCRWPGINRRPYRLDEEEYQLLKLCDGETDIPKNHLADRLFLLKIIHPCRTGEENLSPNQFREYPNIRVNAIDWSLTDRCNYNCLHCFHAADNFMPRDEFSLEQAYHLIDEAKACGILGFRLTGGEPTIHPYFREVVKRIRERGMRVGTLITNGSRLDATASGQ